MIGPSTHVFENKKIHSISNGNRTEWSPIRSVIIRVNKKNQTIAWRESDLFNHEYDYRPNQMTQSSVTN